MWVQSIDIDLVIVDEYLLTLRKCMLEVTEHHLDLAQVVAHIPL